MAFIFSFVIVLLLHGIQSLQTGILLIFTAPNSRLRLIGTLYLVYFCNLQWGAIQTVFEEISYRSISGSVCVTHTAHCVNLLIDARVNVPALAQSKSRLKGLLSALELSLNLRGIRTPWQVSRLPDFPGYLTHDKRISRRQFIARQALTSIWVYFIFDMIHEQWKDLPPHVKKMAYGPGTEILSAKANIGQICARVALSAAFLLWVKTFLDYFYRLFSIISVGIGLTCPEDWPPLFGSIWNVYSLRNFWR